MTYEVLLSDDAARDLDELYAAAFSRSLRRGSEGDLEGFLGLVSGLFESLSDAPERGRIAPELADVGLSEYLEVRSGDVRVVYTFDGETVVVLLLAGAGRSMQQLLQRRLLEV